MFRSSQDRSFEKKEIMQTVNNGYSCDLCGEGPWTAELDLEIHRKNQHKWDLLRQLKDENTPMCSICLRTQENKKALIEHILVQHFCCPPNATMLNREIYICDHCQRLFFNKQLLAFHIYHWHTKKTPENSDVRFECPKCWKNIRAKSSWFHLLYHGVFNVGTCPVCLKICENHSEMLEHMKIHPNVFRCNICQFETTKECYLNSHLEKHKKNNVLNDSKDEVSRFFLPEQLLPSLNNQMCHIFKGIPLANQVRICILCKTFVFSAEEMEQHIFGAHVPEEKEKSKTYHCYCGEEFFSSILLKQHIFKLKGDHGAWDGVSPIPGNTSFVQQELFNVYQIYGISDPLTADANEVVISAINEADDENVDSSESYHDVTEYEVMES